MIGILMEISYKGKYFDAFDEIKDKKTVKGILKSYLIKKGINIYKGIQQAGRTDAKVSAMSNYIYFMTNKFDFSIIDKNIDIEGLKILNIYEFPTNISLPDVINKRYYIYHLPKKLIFAKTEDIKKRCLEISGEKDFSNFTNNKGLKLKNKVRNVNVEFDGEKLHFYGNSFLPQQVRIMSNYILNNSKKPAPPKYLYLNKVFFEESFNKFLINED